MPYRPRLSLLAFVCLLCASAVSVFAEDWPQWRGPRGDGSSTDTTVPTKWSKTENVKWRVPLPGKGHGSPVVAGGRVYLNTAIEKEGRRVLMCLDRADGKVVWQRDVLVAPLEKKHGLNSYASSTPLVAGGRVFVTFLDIAVTSQGTEPKPNTKTQGMPLIVAYDLNGKEAWRKHLGKFSSIHGWSCSPVAYGENVIVNCDHDGPGYIVCLKQSTGEEVWRIERPNRTRSYVNPVFFDVGGTKHMVLSGSKCTASYDPDTGKQRWMFDGPTEQFCASFVMTEGLFFMTSGFPTHHTLGIDPADGKEVWHAKGNSLAAYVPSPVAHGPWVFLVTDENRGEGRGVCFEAKTGKVLWSQPLGPHHRASALVANGNIYWLADDGSTFVVKAADKFELVAKNELGEACNAAPAISDGQIFIRTNEALWCVGK